MDPVQLFNFLSRPRTIREVAERFGMTLEEVELILQEPLESGRALVWVETDRDSTERFAEPSQSVSFLPKSQDTSKEKVMPAAIPGRMHNENYTPGSYQKLHFKFKETTPNVVKQTQPTAVPAELFEAKANGRHESPSHVSLSLKAQMLDSLAVAPKTLMDLRVALGVSYRNVVTLEHKGLVESFYGPKGVGRTFRITKKGLIELKRLKTASSIQRRVMEKPLITSRKIVPPIRV